MPAVTKIVITGGPCAGKTTALASIQTAFSRLGYKVVTVPEPATEFISNGVTPWECSSAEEYQWCQMRPRHAGQPLRHDGGGVPARDR